MARARENARLRRAVEMGEEARAPDLVGQIIVIGFGGKPRIVEFKAHGERSMRAVDQISGVEESLPVALAWRIARLASEDLKAKA